MMIQRMQSVYLLVAAALMGWFCFTNLGSIGEDTVITVQSNTILWIVSILTAVIYFLAIFLFKNPKKQKSAIYAAMIVTIGVIATSAIIIFGGEESISPDCNTIAPVLALIGAIRAIQGINKDVKTLRDAERIR